MAYLVEMNYKGNVVLECNVSLELFKNIKPTSIRTQKVTKQS